LSINIRKIYIRACDKINKNIVTDLKILWFVQFSLHIAYRYLPKAATICFLRHRYCRTVCVMKMSTSEENPFLVWNSTANKMKQGVKQD
jgi:hypothetical protein